MAQALAYIAPGHANLYLASSVMTIKPISIQNLKEVSPISIRDYWHSKSTSSVKE